MAEALAEEGVEARVKWPNDIHVGERKIAGLLAEASSTSRGVDWVVLGIGINLVPPPGVPESASVTSLQEVGCSTDRLAVAAAVLGRLTVCYHALDRPQDIVERWSALSLPWWGRAVEVRSEGPRIEGVARGVDPRGALLLELADGSLTAIVSGEARELRLR